MGLALPRLSMLAWTLRGRSRLHCLVGKYVDHNGGIALHSLVCHHFHTHPITFRRGTKVKVERQARVFQMDPCHHPGIMGSKAVGGISYLKPHQNTLMAGVWRCHRLRSFSIQIDGVERIRWRMASSSAISRLSCEA